MRKTAFVFVFSVVAGLMSAQNPVSYCVENEITHDFLNDFSYDSLDLTVSYVMKYFNKPHDYRLDAPVPVRLSWNHEAGADAQRVEVSESSVYTDSIVFTINKDTAQYDLYNMIPGKKYYYRIVSVKGGDETVVKKDSLEPTGMLRWLYVEGTWNVRDMGGWPGLGGHPIKYGQLFRGAQLTNPKDPYNVILTSAGKEAMRNAGIHAELDLRSSSQAHYSTASFATNSYAADFTNIATTSARMWQYDKDDSNIRAIQWVINELKAGKPVFYHCQNGADRTGTIGLLIGALLGMSESDLAKDYELTTFCQKAAVAFDPTEVGFARLRNYEGMLSDELSKKMAETEIRNMDFEAFLNMFNFTSKDFVFLDPPYDSDFSTYDQKTFDKDEQIRLKKTIKSIKANWMLVIKKTDFIFELYKDFYVYEYDKNYNVSFKNRNDKEVRHLLITNYKLKEV